MPLENCKVDPVIWVRKAEYHKVDGFLYKMYNIGMNIKTLSTTKVRANIREIMERVKTHGEVFVFGRRNNPEAVLVKFPDVYNSDFSDITNINAYSGSFDFLKNEPDLYESSLVKKKYV